MLLTSNLAALCGFGDITLPISFQPISLTSMAKKPTTGKANRGLTIKAKSNTAVSKVSAPSVPITERTDLGAYRADLANWITLASGEYYPDILPDACELYK